MLTLKSVNVEIQNSTILRDISLAVSPGELVCLVGRNGAGKTTTFRSIMGYVQPKSGSIEWKGESIVGMKTHQIARRGIAFSPEESEVFGDLTVAENIALPTDTIKTGRSAQERIDLAYHIFPKLERYRERSGTHLSGGERKMLSIARAVAMDPQLLLLDEPFEGLSPAVIPTISEGIASIRKLGRAVLMAESNGYHIPDYADKVYVIERGEIVFEGSVAQARSNDMVSRIIGA
ncbi:ABC transporter ATP-binding protein [Lacisediminimonas sp.]|uniref:ABC transporter ATP-binding protein n=1 Tax=Lacisediminimonas sp. TaxID=3060582 RepID=UPI00271DD193|nr:ABC transporter ATP-binding protein [Lacisediminimonas sp.]MDO8299604.1 ABC transporter ATP-binding protein [Lacisediminimonas sp.]